MFDFQKFLTTSSFVKNLRRGLRERQRTIYLSLSIIFAGYFAANGASSYFMKVLMDRTLSIRPQKYSRRSFDSNGLGKKPNYRTIQKKVLRRNVFNSEGEFPDEKEPEQDKKAKTVFDAEAPCQKTSLKLELIGTIYLGEKGPSIATVKEEGYNFSDIYRVGDAIIDHEHARIVAIHRQKVVLNNNGAKECLEFVENSQKSFGPAPTNSRPISEESHERDEEPGSSSTCTLQSSFVEAQLGPGFGKIVQAARLVPNTVENAINGFKIFAIKSGSLFSKIGLKNGDIITQVNDTSLKQPEQGFALYQAFQDEREVRINILRRGKTPKSIVCHIK